MSFPTAQRIMLVALACLACGATSCSRQQPRGTAQSNPAAQPAPPMAASPDSRGVQPGAGAPQTSATTPLAIAALAIGTDRSQPPQQAALSQAPDRVFNSGHTADVTAVAISPDGKHAATGGEDKTIRIWDVATETEQRVLTGHSERILALGFSPSGARLASSGGDGTVRVWDAGTGNLAYSFSMASKFVEQVAFSSDGKILAASAGADDEGGNSYIEIHEAATGAKVRGISVDWNNALPLVITSDGRLLSSGGGGEDGEYVSAKIWDWRTGRELKTLQALFNAISPDGRWGVSLGLQQGTQINLWDIAAGRRVRTISVPGFDASRPAFTPDGTRIVLTGKNLQSNRIEAKFFEIGTGKEVQTLAIPSPLATISADGKWLAVGSGTSAEIWDIAANRAIATLAGQLAAQDLAFTPDGKQLITGGARLGIWDFASGKLLRTLQGATQSLALSADGRWLAANPNGNLEVWDTNTWMRVTLSPRTGANVWWMDFASFTQPPAVDFTAIGLRWWQIGGGAEARSVWGTTFAAAMSPDGKILATASLRVPSASAYDRPNVSIWDLPSGRLLEMFNAHEVGVSAVEFSPDGKWLATSGQESRLDPAHVGASLAAMKRSIKIWDTGTWQMRNSVEFTGMTGGGLGRFSPDSRWLTVTGQNSVTVYGVPDLREVKELSGGGGAARFSPDGAWIARGGRAGIALWRLSQ